MKETMDRVLRECLCLEDNPFDPGADPRLGFNFRQTKASLSRPLDVFNIEGLEPYFIKIGMFEQAVNDVQTFLDASGLTLGVDPPPMFLIQAESGVGRSSLANYIAYLVKERLIAGGPAALHTETVQGEDLAKLIFSLKKVIEIHARQCKVAGCELAFEVYPDSLIGRDSPDRALMNNLFQQLAGPLADAPPLLVVVESITYKRVDWMLDLYQTLSPLNIALILLTDDERVTRRYDELVSGNDVSGVSVSLEPFDQPTAEAFFNRRFGSFRRQPCAGGGQPLFPLETAIFDMAFKPEKDEDEIPTYGVKFLLNVFRGALNLKLLELSKSFNPAAPPPPPQQFQTEQLLITWKHVENSFRRAVRKTARARR